MKLSLTTLQLLIFILALSGIIVGCRSEPVPPPSEIVEARAFADSTFNQAVASGFDNIELDSATLVETMEILYDFDPNDLAYFKTLYFYAAYETLIFSREERINLLDSAEVRLRNVERSPSRDTLLGLFNNTLAVFYSEISQYDLALHHSDRAVQFYEAINSTVGIITELLNSTNTHGYISDYNAGQTKLGKAEELFKDSVEMVEYYKALYFNNLLVLTVPEAYLRKMYGQTEELNRLLNLVFSKKDQYSQYVKFAPPIGQMIINFNIMGIFINFNRPLMLDSITHYYEQGMKIANQIPESYREAFYAKIVEPQIQFLTITKQFGAAERKIDSTLKNLNLSVAPGALQIEELKTQLTETLDFAANLLTLKARLYFYRYEEYLNPLELETAIRISEDIFLILDYLRSRATVGKDVVGIRERYTHAYFPAVDHALTLAEIERKQEYLEEAFSVYLERAFALHEEAKFFGLKKVVNERIDSANTSINQQKLIERESALQQKKLELEASLTTASKKEKPKITGEIIEISKKLISFYDSDELKKDPALFSYFINRAIPPIPSVSRIQQEMLDSNSAIFAHRLSGERPGYFVITKNHFHFYPIKRDTTFYKAIDALRAVSSKQMPLKNYHEAAWILYDRLFCEGLESGYLTNTNRLKIMPDDLLFNFPYDMLITKQLKEDDLANFEKIPFLIKDFTTEIHYSLTATSLFDQLDDGRDAPQDIQTYIARYTENSIAENEQFRCMEKELNFMATTFKQEIKKKLEPYNLRVFDPAKETDFKNNAPSSSILYLIMHGCEGTIPLKYGLAFTNEPNNENDPYSQGELTGEEIQAMALNAKMVILGSCSSNKGKIRQGEGILGIAQAFNLAGCTNVIASIENVLDESTAELMEYFFEGLLNGQDSALALANAKRRYLKEAEEANPVRWANFISIGTPQTLN